jgi:hypothetical protein
MSNLGLPDPLGLFGEKKGTILDPLGVFGGGDKGVAQPLAVSAPEEKPVMPIPDDEATKRKRRRSVAEQRTRSGRASTIFTEGYGLGG